MERRAFLKTGIAAGIAGALPTVSFLPADSQASQPAPADEILSAHMIGCAHSIPVPLKANGPASGIASSEAGHAPILTPDLHAVFARAFTLDALPASASMRLFAYTRYRLYINGICLGRGPSRFQNQRPEYDTRDVLGALRPGRNLIAVLVHRDAPTGRIMRHEPGFAAVLAWGEGANRRTLATDPSWLSRPDLSFGPRDEAWASIEEHVDARKGIDLTDARLSLAGWPASVLVGGPEFFPVWPRTTPLQSETTRAFAAGHQPFPLILDPARPLTLDLPEIVQGYHDLEFGAAEGSELEVEYLLPESDTGGRSTYIARAGIQRYCGGDTFAHSRLALRLRSGSLTLHRAASVEVRYPFQRAGSFESSDPLLTRLWAICARSLELMSEDSYVDCADRERVEWTDDSPPAFDCTRVMMRGPASGEKQFWGDNRLLKGLLRRIAHTQQPDGQIKAHSCSERWDIHAIMEDRSCDWVVLLREYLESSGDLPLVRELWPTLTRLLQWFLDRRSARGLVLAREWEVWDNPLRYQVCEGAGLNAFFFRALNDAAWLAGQIGEQAAAAAYAADADRLAADFNTLLWNPAEGAYDGALFGPGSETREQLNGKMFPGPVVNGRYRPTAQAALFALYAGIVPAGRLAPLRAWMLAHLDGITGPMSHYYLFHALYAVGEQAHDTLVLDRMRAGWKLQVDSPWQTTWEELVNTGGSKAHLYGLVPGALLTTHVLGARRIGPISDRSILIEPRCGDLVWAKGTAITEFGPVPMKWSKSEDGGLSIECTLPPGTKGTLRLYRQDGKGTVVVDSQPRKAQFTGEFLELALTPGQHTIHYPA